MRKVLFITGTRADFGKQKALMREVEVSSGFELHVFVTGMHMLSKYGMTLNEVKKEKFENLYPHFTGTNLMHNEAAAMMQGFGYCVNEVDPDLIVVYGDRVEALAAASVGMLNNILVAHVEGGEVSGTVDEMLRHAVTKLSHIHFVANDEAWNRVLQLGEDSRSIYVIGSPDIDIMLGQLPGLEEVKARYGIKFDNYLIFVYHPVVTELGCLKGNIRSVVAALELSGNNYVVIYPNSDSGSDVILDGIRKLENNSRFKLIPSMRFEYFLTLLKNARAIVGNSSVGIREAPVFGVPVVNIGTRQDGRYNCSGIVNCGEHSLVLFDVLKGPFRKRNPDYHFGYGNSAKLFMDALEADKLWDTPKQKQFVDFRKEVG